MLVFFNILAVLAFLAGTGGILLAGSVMHEIAGLVSLLTFAVLAVGAEVARRVGELTDTIKKLLAQINVE